MGIVNIDEGISAYSDYKVGAISSWRVGGSVRYFKEVNSQYELEVVLSFISRKGLSWAIVGRTTNLLFTDQYMDGFLIRLGAAFSEICVKSEKISVGAGVFAPRLARKCASSGLTGLEHIAGIPASIGGLIAMNGGSCRKSISGNVVQVTSVTSDGYIKNRNAASCNFGYRESVFKYSDEVIISCNLELSEAEVASVRRESLSIMKSRRNKFPLKLPNCGSVFKSSPEMYEQFGPPGYVIEKSGFKGYSIGGAQISPIHANFIVNIGEATSGDILALIKVCIDAVQEKTGHVMEPEVRFVDSNLCISNIA